MFGTIARLRVKPGQEQALIDMTQEWERERKPKVKGAGSGYLLRPENRPSEMILVAVFEDRESYYANAADPEQDRWFRRIRELLEADPEWEDGEIIGM